MSGAPPVEVPGLVVQGILAGFQMVLAAGAEAPSALDHRRDGWLSFLHLSAANKRAKELYERLGFAVNREVNFHRAVRSG